MVILEEIQRFFGGKISLNEPLARFTTFRIGGPADYYLEPKDKEDLLQVVQYLHQQAFPYIVIGSGSNMLVSDKGYRGAVISLAQGFADIGLEGDMVDAGAGVRLSQFVDFCVEHSLRGTEMLAGIPGTLGGAIMMNAGAYGGEISDYLVEVEILRGSSFKKIKKEEGGFRYRKSDLGQDIIVRARFSLPSGEKEELKRVRNELIRKRNETQPVNFPNAGSVFKNPPGDRAARLIEACGLKGLTVGGAEVSERHANFIVNRGQASAKDVLELIEMIHQRILDQFNINLELEVRLIGFGTTTYEETTNGRAERAI